MCTHLSNLEAIVNNMLEGAHLHFADELRLHYGFVHDKRNQLAEVAQDQLGFVMGGRVER